MTIRHIYLRLMRVYYKVRLRLLKEFNHRAYLKYLVDADQDGSNFEAIDDYLYFETQHWKRRADAVHVSVADLPLREGETHWGRTYDGFSCLNWESLRLLKKAVEEAEYEKGKRRREGRELLAKWFTALAAAVAAGASLFNVWLTWHNGKK